MMKPKSCDTFAVLPSSTLNGTIVFGKNSDRESDEVQEVVHVSASDYPPDSKLKCTYIQIDQVSHTYAVVLSKPSWMWGAEMGANEHSVCIGNEAVFTVLNSASDSDEKLLGMDLLRLGLERGKTALESLNVIVSLIDKYGMGGKCSETDPDFTYHNSFLIADPFEVWVLECAGAVWAAERVTEGFRNISNELLIRSKIDLKMEGLEQFAEEKGFWKPSNGPFDFKLVFDLNPESSFRYTAGRELLSNLSRDKTFTQNEMFKVLRDKPSDICMSCGSFVTTGSQVSVLRKPGSGASCHWFTSTPCPDQSIFKPFFFSETVTFPEEVVSPGDWAVSSANREHLLYKQHKTFRVGLKKKKKYSGTESSALKTLENKYVKLAEEVALNYEEKKSIAGKIFSDAVCEEYALYS